VPTRFLEFAMLALFAAAAIASTQPQAPSTADPIVVEGRTFKETATDYLDKLIPANIGLQLGRFDQPICPKVMGLAEPYNTQVVDRVREVAKATSIGAAGPGCTPNLVIISAADKKAMIAALQRTRPGYVASVGNDELRRIANSHRPFAAWQVTDEVAADGMPIGSSGNFAAPGNGASDKNDKNGNYVGGDYARLKTTVSPSRLRDTVKLRVLTSVVIVETGALSNVTTRQLADFALVKAMTPTEEREREAPASSILSLFDASVTPEGAPQSVTWWDFAFLKSLANTRSDSFADIQRSEIQSQMVKEVKKVPAGL
jgi:hypothetical protein